MHTLIVVASLLTPPAGETSRAWVFVMSDRDRQLADELTLVLERLRVSRKWPARTFASLPFRQQVRRARQAIGPSEVAIWVTLQDTHSGFVQLVVGDSEKTVRTLQVSFDAGWQVAAALTVREILATTLGPLIRRRSGSAPPAPPPEPPRAPPPMRSPATEAVLATHASVLVRGPISAHRGSSGGLGGELSMVILFPPGLFGGLAASSLRTPLWGEVRGWTLGPAVSAGWAWSAERFWWGLEVAARAEWHRLTVRGHTLEFWQFACEPGGRLHWALTGALSLVAAAGVAWTPYRDQVQLNSTGQSVWSNPHWSWQVSVGLSAGVGFHKKGRL